MAKYPPVKPDMKLLSPRDMRDLRVEGGLTPAEIGDPMSAAEPEKAMAALAWIITRRDHPECTIEEAWDIDFDFDLGGGPAVDPTTAGS